MWLFVLLSGLAIGSFLNVVILRTQRRESLLGRSHCPSCKRTLGVLDLVPVLSFFVLRGKCRFCHTKISWQYPIVELATGILFLLAFLRLSYGISLPEGFSQETFLIFLVRDLAIISFLIILFVYDFKYGLLPDIFTLPAIVVSLGINIWLKMPLWPLALGGVAICGFFVAQFFLSKGRWVGAGDIRFGFLIGVLLGFANGIAALFLAYVLGAVVSIFLLARRSVGLKTEIPFGTFLSVATLLILLTDSWFVDAYLSLF